MIEGIALYQNFGGSIYNVSSCISGVLLNVCRGLFDVGMDWSNGR